MCVCALRAHVQVNRGEISICLYTKYVIEDATGCLGVGKGVMKKGVVVRIGIRGAEVV